VDGNPSVVCDRNVASRSEAVSALIQVATEQHGVRKDALALVGISTGAIAAYSVLERRRDIRAAVIDSGFGLIDANQIAAPILLLGTSGDEVHYTNQQRDLHSLEAAGNKVEAFFYPDADHVVTQDRRVGRDAIERASTFLHSHLA
jgi:dienelactone hydrolase